MRCHTAQTLLIAARDGQIASPRRRALERHLAGCAGCQAARTSSMRLLDALDALPWQPPVSPRLEQNVLREVRKLAAAEAESRIGFGRLRSGVPVLVTSALAFVAILVGRGLEEPPGHPRAPATGAGAVVQRRAPSRDERMARRRTTVPADPPAELMARPELFMELPILRNMEKLQHFDSIATTDPDDGDAPTDGGAPANG